MGETENCLTTPLAGSAIVTAKRRAFKFGPSGFNNELYHVSRRIRKRTAEASPQQGPALRGGRLRGLSAHLPGRDRARRQWQNWRAACTRPVADLPSAFE
jgi:hypothetical protein